MNGAEKSEKVLGIFNTISENYDDANDRVSLGMQRSWKKHLIERLTFDNPENRLRVLDVCCGSGDIAIALAKQGMQVVGLDFSAAMLAVAERKAELNGLNVRKAEPLNCISFIQADAMKLPFEDKSFDAATISFGLRNTPDYRQVLSEMKRVSKSGVYVLDSFIPQNKLIYPFYKLYFKVLTPLIGGGSRFKDEYRWLFESTEQFLSPGELCELMKELGFFDVSCEKYNFGTCCLVSGKQ